jgi:hypothetical protein
MKGVTWFVFMMVAFNSFFYGKSKDVSDDDHFVTLFFLQRR